MRRVKTPLPGSYVGTVDGWHALLLVTPQSVAAIWFVARPGATHDHVQRIYAWDVEGGRFRPNGVGTLRFKRGSRIPASGQPKAAPCRSLAQ